MQASFSPGSSVKGELLKKVDVLSVKPVDKNEEPPPEFAHTADARY